MSSNFDSTPGWVDVKMPPEGETSPGECPTCGIIIKMGFFFDAFGRNRDVDQATGMQTNIVKLWLSHKDNTYRDRPLQHSYLRYYYSGLGTPLNEDAGHSNEARIAKDLAVKAISTMGGATGAFKVSSGSKTAQEVYKKATSPTALAKDVFFGDKPLTETWADLKKANQGIEEGAKKVFRYRYRDLWDDTKEVAGKAADGAMKTINEVGESVKRATVDRAKLFLHDVKKRPLRATKDAVMHVVTNLTVERIPVLRDNIAVATWVGSGVDTRLEAAATQFREALSIIGVSPDDRTGIKTQTIEVSVFGADRGCVLARAFVNLLQKDFHGVYSRTGMDFRAVPIEIKFVGLFDAVSSIMESNALVSFTPYLATLKQDFSDRPLSLPPGIECVHMLAAHELRSSQRIDSLEMTRGEQLLFPGSSEDVTGGAPPGRTGLRNALARVPLREMHLRAMAAGVPLIRMERLKTFNESLYKSFSFAPTFPVNGTPKRVDELVDAYRKQTKVYKVNSGAALQPALLAHMKVLLWWLGRRYVSPEFWENIEGELALRRKKYTDLFEQTLRDEAAVSDHQVKHGMRPDSEEVLVERRALYKQRRKSKEEFEVLYRSFNNEYAVRPVHGIWHRLITQAHEVRETRLETDRRKPYTDALKEEEDAFVEMEKFREEDAKLTSSQRHTPERDKKRMELFNKHQEAKKKRAALMSSPDANQYRGTDRASRDEGETAEMLALLPFFEDGVINRNEPPAEVVALFDELVHDTLLNSWHDHILAHYLYFRTRAIDKFGQTDLKAEEKQRKNDEDARKRMEDNHHLGKPKPAPKPPSSLLKAPF